MPSIELKSNDGYSFYVDVQVANMSRTIKTMLEDLGMDENDDEVIPLPNVESEQLKLVIEWAEHHRNDPPREEVENKETYQISEWDRQFIQGLTWEKRFELLLTANYLDISGLMDDLCRFTADNGIKGKTPEEIRAEFSKD
jgi:S-phase kinase-associated protein 1